MIEAKQHNQEMNLAWQYIEGTHVSVFLTGKAGTGKTTFLKKIRELSPKRMVVVAPTGVAAINAQGVTIHSFFQLSIGVHLPGMQRPEGRSYYQFSKEKKNILRTLDLLVIDEISMVRADLLDAIDNVLRTYKDRTQPFGGVQLLLIGDLQQLAPVAVEKEWAMLKDYYDTPYFFSSKALQQISYVTIELKHIYRQSDERFIQLLANVREGNLDAATISALNSRYIANFEPAEEEGFIRLTTHNNMAQRYNEQKLEAINRSERHFVCEVTGEFPENSYPADKDLTLKMGAQVMFIKNDPSADHAFYNGKIGRIVGFSDEGIMVKCPEDQQTIVVGQLSWENTKVTINETTKEIQEEVIGIFKQIPLHLAWAITIHKSQGLTFDRAILDINDSFAHGQVYVALSRCRSLEGMVLSRPLNIRKLAVDESVNQFISKELEEATHASEQLGSMRYEYFKTLLNELFDFRRNYEQMNHVLRIYEEDLYRSNPNLNEQWRKATENYKTNIIEVSMKFKEQYT
ncbi:MAG: AAA family ATPase, partial [Bacteroidaceae bacterium]|nr:AAA family ATPase [Bacteroidaceae bacterium]